MLNNNEFAAKPASTEGLNSASVDGANQSTTSTCGNTTQNTKAITMNNEANETRHGVFVPENTSTNQTGQNGKPAPVNTPFDSPNADVDSREQSTQGGIEKKKGQKIRFGDPKNLGTINQFRELVSDNQPLDMAAQKCGLTMPQAKRLLGTLINEQRVRDYKPRYTIMPVKKQIWKIFSDLPVEFEEVKVIRNDDGSFTVVPVKNS